MLRKVKRFLLVVPMIACMFALSVTGQQTNANTINANERTERLAQISSNRLSLDSGSRTSFGFELNGCYWQVEGQFNGSGVLLCGSTVIFCQNSVDIYTAGEDCS
jgi:hypothetical protein